MRIEHVTVAQAKLTKVRVPFRKSERAWLLPGNRVMRGLGRGPLPVGAVDLGDGTYLNLNSGAIYKVEVSEA
jgi:hypothetical protein